MIAALNPNYSEVQQLKDELAAANEALKQINSKFETAVMMFHSKEQQAIKHVAQLQMEIDKHKKMAVYASFPSTIVETNDSQSITLVSTTDSDYTAGVTYDVTKLRSLAKKYKGTIKIRQKELPDSEEREQEFFGIRMTSQ
eukprot:CAMPEP_0172480546 /NCGR_PEP_ID=MMETSP1066-20121228/5778_1 /TAXON_ID=671091 /ORGANISM="Coscinodiscus wailesii, Strain CCMP2513" /LENGTH=140 /DNA_ID=CAMNT_0013241971 /DNA_START=216 /DNA_END=638 /DNA_ORIENTATION=-